MTGMHFSRKLYRRGSSFETTIPSPLLFALNTSERKYAVVFKFDSYASKWYVEFEELKQEIAEQDEIAKLKARSKRKHR